MDVNQDIKEQGMSDDQAKWKEETRKQWNNIACGELNGDKETLKYFLDVEKYRYDVYAPWMDSFFQYNQYKGKSVLEIGFGQGTDLCQFAKAGAICSGIEITNNHLDLATKNFQLRGLKADLSLEDASNLHFKDDSFDLVYSFGVLHHTPDTIRCISEAYRVLKPGGKLIIALYHRFSAYYLFQILLNRGLLQGKRKKLGKEGLLSTIEKGADGINIKPLVKLYSSKQLRIILGDYREVSIKIKHLSKSHFSFFGRIIPGFLIPRLERKFGWYIIGIATK